MKKVLRDDEHCGGYVRYLDDVFYEASGLSYTTYQVFRIEFSHSTCWNIESGDNI